MELWIIICMFLLTKEIKMNKPLILVSKDYVGLTYYKTNDKKFGRKAEIFIERNAEYGLPIYILDTNYAENWEIGDNVFIKIAGKNIVRHVGEINEIGDGLKIYLYYR